MAKKGEENHDPDMPKSLPKAKREGKQPTLYTGMYKYGRDTNVNAGPPLDMVDNDQIARLKTFKNATYTASQELTNYREKGAVHQECDEAIQFFSGSEA